jgi:hypothetical protein
MNRITVWVERWRIRRAIVKTWHEMNAYEHKSKEPWTLRSDPKWKEMETQLTALQSQLDRTIYKPKTKQ